MPCDCGATDCPRCSPIPRCRVCDRRYNCDCIKCMKCQGNSFITIDNEYKVTCPECDGEGKVAK